MTNATCILPDRLVVFVVDGQRYALPVDLVCEIQQIVAFRDRGPASGPVLGMVDLRGVTVPALDLRSMLIGEPAGLGLQTPMVIARASHTTVALVVDSVDDVLAVPSDCLQEPPAFHPLGPSLVGVVRIGEATVNVLDLDRMLHDVAEVA